MNIFHRAPGHWSGVFCFVPAGEGPEPLRSFKAESQNNQSVRGGLRRSNLYLNYEERLCGRPYKRRCGCIRVANSDERGAVISNFSIIWLYLHLVGRCIWPLVCLHPRPSATPAPERLGTGSGGHVLAGIASHLTRLFLR